MNIPEFNPADLLPMVPAIVLSLGAIFLLLTEVFLSTGSRAYQAVVAAVTAAVAMMFAASTATEPARVVFQGFAVQDPFSQLMTAVICLGVLLAVLVSPGFLRPRHAERGEFYALVLFAGAGMSLLSLSNELIALFINLEVMSIATYALAAYLRRGPRPAEAGFKYFILGAFSSALLLYGASLLYAGAGTTKLTELGYALTGAFARAPLLTWCGVLLVGAGFAFKVAAVPFHMWTPDVYEGAPTPVTALMSVGVKAAAFAAMVRVFLAVGQSADPSMLISIFSALAALTMIGGNLMALPQRNVKRMLAYSSIAHAGYLLIGVAALFAIGRPGQPGVSLFGQSNFSTTPEATLQAELLRSIVFYMLAYTVTTAGAFGLIAGLERREDDDRGLAWDLDRFSGLATRRPGWAFAMAVFMLSLGGIPPTVGFMGKLLVFRAAIDAGLIGLVIIGVLTSAAAIYYYLRVVVHMYMRPAPEGSATYERHWPTELGLILSTVAVVLLGIVPSVISPWLDQAGQIFGLAAMR